MPYTNNITGLDLGKTVLDVYSKTNPFIRIWKKPALKVLDTLLDNSNYYPTGPRQTIRGVEGTGKESDPILLPNVVITPKRLKLPVKIMRTVIDNFANPLPILTRKIKSGGKLIPKHYSGDVLYPYIAPYPTFDGDFNMWAHLLTGNLPPKFIGSETNPYPLQDILVEALIPYIFSRELNLDTGEQVDFLSYPAGPNANNKNIIHSGRYSKKDLAPLYFIGLPEVGDSTTREDVINWIKQQDLKKAKEQFYRDVENANREGRVPHRGGRTRILDEVKKEARNRK